MASTTTTAGTLLSSLSINDPEFDGDKKPSAFARLVGGLIRDRRDVVFVRYSLVFALGFFPAMVYLFWPGNFNWILGLGYTAAVLFWMPPYILMLHNTSHRKLFKSDYSFLNGFIPYIVGPVFGQTPGTYYAHHVQMHHSEANLPKDLSSTMAYQRDSLFGFLSYFTKFFTRGMIDLVKYFLGRNKKDFAWRVFIGEMSYYGLMIGLSFYNWAATLCVFIFPFVFSRFAMMAGNWAQHAFIDAADPGNSYRNSITCIDSAYNRRCFNDGYHIGHHVLASRHWTDMPADFMDNRQKYIDNDSIVFHTLDYFVIWLLLMTHSYKTLARYFVQLDEQNPKTEEQIIALMKTRLKAIPAAA